MQRLFRFAASLLVATTSQAWVSTTTFSGFLPSTAARLEKSSLLFYANSDNEDDYESFYSDGRPFVYGNNFRRRRRHGNFYADAFYDDPEEQEEDDIDRLRPQRRRDMNGFPSSRRNRDDEFFFNEFPDEFEQTDDGYMPMQDGYGLVDEYSYTFHPRGFDGMQRPHEYSNGYNNGYSNGFQTQPNYNTPSARARDTPTNRKESPVDTDAEPNRPRGYDVPPPSHRRGRRPPRPGGDYVHDLEAEDRASREPDWDRPFNGGNRATGRPSNRPPPPPPRDMYYEEDMERHNRRNGMRGNNGFFDELYRRSPLARPRPRGSRDLYYDEGDFPATQLRRGQRSPSFWDSIFEPFEGALRAFDDMFSPFSRQRRSLLNPFVFLDSPWFLSPPPFEAFFGNSMRDEAIEPILKTAEDLLNDDVLCVNELGPSIRLGQVYSQSSAASSINGRTQQMISLEVEVQGLNRRGAVKILADDRAIQDMILMVGADDVGDYREIHVEIPGSRADRRRRGPSPGMNDRMNPRRPNMDNVIDAEAIEDDEEKIVT